MALRVWLPLNGNINNYGISDAVVTNSGATIDNNGKIGKCYSFGSSKRITISQPDNLSTSSASLSCWVNLSSWGSSYDSLVNLSTGTGWNDTRLALVRNNTANRIGFCIANGSTYNYVVMTSDLPLNTWTHLAGTFDGSTIKIYVNGILNNSLSATFSSLIYGSAVLNLGSWSNGNNYPINGKLNDVRLYDHCLSAKEVKEISKGLCLHYKLDGICNTIDNTEWDCSGFSNNGTKSGSITVSNDTARYSSSYKFDTTSSKIKLPVLSYSGLANSYSFSWWQKNTSSNNMPWGFSDGNRLNLYHTTNLCWNTGDSGGNPFKDSSGAAIPNTKLCDNTWHHCVITGNGSITKLYIDGVYVGAATTYKAITGTQIYISGWDTGTSYTFSGSNLSDFRIYATVLSDLDIKELYNTSLSIDNVGNMYTYEFKEIE